jgi:cytochrome d ubiquinol oxidase subunit I
LIVASDLLAAREQMAFTLGFHIILVPFGVAFPFIVLIAHYRALRHDDADALLLAQRWSKVMAVLFAVGAVTGTVLSIEMGLLWPGLFDKYGAVIGVPFAIEGLAFFLEAIFIGIYLYGWKRLSPWKHFASGIPIVLAGILGTVAVISANAWMNQPTGFVTEADGSISHVNPLAAMFNRASAYEMPHMLLAAYMVAGFCVASVYAVGMLRGRRDRYHRLGFTIAFAVAAVAAPLQVFVGDVAARAVFHDQPSKFAAMELITQTGSDRALHVGGVLIDGEVRYAISIPGGDSLLAGLSTSTSITGLDQIPIDEQPPVNVVHLAFQVMVAIGTALVALSAWFGLVFWRRRRLPNGAWFLRASALAGLASIAALEAGWITTEVGRQPWIAYKLLLTKDAVTHAGGVWVSYGVIVAVYIALGVATLAVIRNMTRRWRQGDTPADANDAPYGPRPMPSLGDDGDDGGGDMSSGDAGRSGFGGVLDPVGDRVRT